MSDRTPIDVARNPADLRSWTHAIRTKGQTIALVPTMGALHDGHMSLIAEAHRHADVVIASVFVNPTQFAAHEDLDTYPRAEAKDLEMLENAGCALAYCPSVTDMYPIGDKTRVTVEDISFILEGEFRPHFFIGVATIVSRLFIHVMPDVAVFGEKDYQQLLIIRRMAKDLGLPVNVVGATTIREPDGLAMSSRNAYLSNTERRNAAGFSQALRHAVHQLETGQSISDAIATAYDAIGQAGLGKIDYVAVRDAEDLSGLGDGLLPSGRKARILAAAWMGKTRLIDNMPVMRK